jgi:hypothetical protein
MKGSNDVLSPNGGGVAPIRANLPVILTALREAAGPDVPIVGMNYYSPFLVQWFSDPASLPVRVAAAAVFNDLLEGDLRGVRRPRRRRRELSVLPPPRGSSWLCDSWATVFLSR